MPNGWQRHGPDPAARHDGAGGDRAGRHAPATPGRTVARGLPPSSSPDGEMAGDRQAAWLVPGPRAPGLWQTAGIRLNPAGYLKRTRHRYGAVFAIHLAPAGRLTVVCEPAAAARLLEGCPQAGTANAATLPGVLAERSVFFTDGAANRHRRALHQAWLEGADFTGLERRLAEAIGRAVSAWPAGRPFRLLPQMRRILAEGLVPLLAASPEEARQCQLTGAGRRLMTGPVALAASAVPSHPAARRVAAALAGHHHRAFGQLIGEEIARRAGASGRAPGDALGAMLAARDIRGRPFGAAVIRDELTSLLMALVDVQAIALTWAFERLTRHPGVAAKLRAAAAAGDESYPGAVVDEVLRVRPPIIGAFRTLDGPCELGGVRLPAGTRVMAAIPLLHQQTAPDAGTFCPERFLDGPPPGCIAFGGGERRCPGADLARFTIRTVITAVARQARLRPARTGGETAWLAGTALIPGRLGTVIRDP